VLDENPNAKKHLEKFAVPEWAKPKKEIPSGLNLQVGKVGTWDAGWSREIRLNASDGYRDVTQRMCLITPEYIKARADNYDWTAYYLTSEFTAQELRPLLFNHLATKKNPVESLYERHKIVYRFF